MEYKLKFENGRSCEIYCESDGKPLQDKINAAEERFGSKVKTINGKEVKEHGLGGFLVGAIIGGIAGNAVAKQGLKKTVKQVARKTTSTVKKAVDSVKKKEAPKSKRSNYIPNRLIDSIETKSGKTIENKDIIDGAHTKSKVLVSKKRVDSQPKDIDKSKKLSLQADYLSARKIKVVNTTYGRKLKGSEIIDGAYVKKGVFADGGSIDSFNFKKFKLDELIAILPEDVQFMWMHKEGDDNYENYIRSYGPKYKSVKNIYWTITDYSKFELSKGEENIYLDMMVYNEDIKSPEVPYTISLYTKDNHLGLKNFASMLIQKFKDGGSTESRPNFSSMSKEELIEYSKKNNIPYATGWSKETLIDTIEDALDSRYAKGGGVKKLSTGEKLDLIAKRMYGKTYSQLMKKGRVTNGVQGFKRSEESEKVFKQYLKEYAIPGSHSSSYADGGGVDSKRYKVIIYHGGEKRDQVKYASTLEEARELSFQGEHSEIVDTKTNKLVYGDGGSVKQDYRVQFINPETDALEENIVSAYSMDDAAQKVQNQMNLDSDVRLSVIRTNLGNDKYTLEQDKDGSWKVLDNSKDMYVDRDFNSKSAAESFIQSRNLQRNLVGFESYFENGGRIDLFDTPDEIPSEVQAIMSEYELEDNDYQILEELQGRLETETGYTFDFGLDGTPYGLRPVGVSIEEIQNSEMFANGGGVEMNSAYKANSKYLNSLSSTEKNKILQNIANHYGITIEEANEEVTTPEAEYLYEYIANNASLRYEIYTDMKSGKFAKGGMTEHGLRLGDKILKNAPYKLSEYILVEDKRDNKHFVNLDRGERGKAFAKGGVIGQEITFNHWSGDVKRGTIDDVHSTGEYIVQSGFGSMLVNPDDVISISSPEKEKRFLGIFEDGGFVPSGYVVVIANNERLEFPAKYHFDEATQKESLEDIDFEGSPDYKKLYNFISKEFNEWIQNSRDYEDMYYGDGDQPAMFNKSGAIWDAIHTVIYEDLVQKKKDGKPAVINLDKYESDFISAFEYEKGGKLKYAKGGGVDKYSYNVLNENTNEVYFRSPDKTYSSRKFEEFRAMYPKEKISLYKVTAQKDGSSLFKRLRTTWPEDKKPNPNQKFNGPNIEKKILALKRKGLIVKKLRTDPNGGFYYKIQSKENQYNDIGTGIGYSIDDFGKDSFYHHSHGKNDQDVGNIWYHRGDGNGPRGWYTFDQDYIEDLIRKISANASKKFGDGGAVDSFNLNQINGKKIGSWTCDVLDIENNEGPVIWESPKYKYSFYALPEFDEEEPLAFQVERYGQEEFENEYNAIVFTSPNSKASYDLNNYLSEVKKVIDIIESSNSEKLTPSKFKKHFPDAAYNQYGSGGSVEYAKGGSVDFDRYDAMDPEIKKANDFKNGLVRYLKLHYITILNQEDANYDTDASIDLENGYHLSISSSYVMLSFVNDTDDEEAFYMKTIATYPADVSSYMKILDKLNSLNVSEFAKGGAVKKKSIDFSVMYGSPDWNSLSYQQKLDIEMNRLKEADLEIGDYVMNSSGMAGRLTLFSEKQAAKLDSPVMVKLDKPSAIVFGYDKGWIGGYYLAFRKGMFGDGGSVDSSLLTAEENNMLKLILEHPIFDGYKEIQTFTSGGGNYHTMILLSNNHVVTINYESEDIQYSLDTYDSIDQYLDPEAFPGEEKGWDNEYYTPNSETRTANANLDNIPKFFDRMQNTFAHGGKINTKLLKEVDPDWVELLHKILKDPIFIDYQAISTFYNDYDVLFTAILLKNNHIVYIAWDGMQMTYSYKEFKSIAQFKKGVYDKEYEDYISFDEADEAMPDHNKRSFSFYKSKSSEDIRNFFKQFEK